MIPWDKTDFGPRIGIAYRIMNKTVLRLGYGIFYGGEENQGGSPNRGEGVPFNETVNLSRYQGNSNYVGISQPQCFNCDFMPGGFAGGYPLSPFTLNAGVSMRGVQPDFDNPLVHKWNFVLQRELRGDMALELGYEGNHQAHQVILWNSDPYPNLGTFNTSISSASLQEIQPACSTCQSVGNGLSMTSYLRLRQLRRGFGEDGKAVQPRPAVPDVLCLEPRAGQQRYSAERFEQSGADFADQLGDRIFQRIVGYPA